MPKPRKPQKPGPTNPRSPNTAGLDPLVSGDELAVLRKELEAAGAPPEILQVLDAGGGDPAAVMQRLLESGLLPSPSAPLEGLLDGWKPLLERGTTQLDAELCGAEFISLFRLNSPNEADLPGMLVDLVWQAKGNGRPEAYAMVRVLAVTASAQVREAATAAANEMAAGGHTDLPWMRGLGTPTVRDSYGYGDEVGAQESIAMRFTYGRRSHAMAVLIDHDLGGGVKDCWFTDDADGLLANVRQVTLLQRIELREYEPAQARAILDRALAAEPCPAQPDQIEDVTTYLDLVRSRVSLLPGADSALPGADSAPTRRAGTRRRTSTPPARPTSSPSVHRLKITLKGSKPPIWRRVEVPSAITLQKLHDVVQQAFGWSSYHLWMFDTPLGEYGQPDPGLGHRSAASKKLADVAPRARDKLNYLYDFGDGWEHAIVVERVEPAQLGIAYPRCTGGRRACPPEDCGGIWGYEELLDVLADPGHQEHSDRLEWLGLDKADDFDPAFFDVDESNGCLSGLAKILIRT